MPGDQQARTFDTSGHEQPAESRIVDLREAIAQPWRIGAKLGRTVYAMQGDSPDVCDAFLGIFDSPDVAAYVVQLHNLARSRMNFDPPAPGDARG